MSAFGAVADIGHCIVPMNYDAIDPGCVKTHTSAKCGKHNSPARHRTSRVQYDLTLKDAIAQRYFYVWRERRSFRTAKTRRRHLPFKLGAARKVTPEPYSALCNSALRTIAWRI